MDLWIRTQDKETILKVDEINLFEFDNFCRLETPTCVLGKYITKERALEVLNEIQKRIKNNLIVNYEPIGENPYGKMHTEQLKAIVYEMPKE